MSFVSRPFCPPNMRAQVWRPRAVNFQSRAWPAITCSPGLAICFIGRTSTSLCQYINARPLFPRASFSQRVVEVGDQVGRVLQADGEAQHGI
jgi:hypothetical protein